MLRKTSGSSLCYACGKLNRVDASVCFYCGRRNPGLWGFGPWLGRLAGRLDFSRIVTVVCIAAYAASLLLDPAAAMRPRGVFNLLSPSGGALLALGMTGAYPWQLGYWWTLLTAIYLHGSLLHIAFNLLWIHQLAPAVEQAYGRSRLVLIFTGGGVLGFVISNWAGVGTTIGASGAVFGLLGAMAAYGRSRAGLFGMAVFRQYWQWAVVLFVMGFLMPGVNNFAHAGGFAGGYLTGMIVGHGDSQLGRGLHRTAATAAVALTALAFALAVWNAFGA
ncbi:MAG: rhomboid family intramembrane serine protease [candidate division NC10 bacterium]